MEDCHEAVNYMQNTPQPRGIYLHSCPNCGRSVADDRLQLNLPCPRCLSVIKPVEDIVDAYKLVLSEGKVVHGSPLEYYAKVEMSARELEEVFRKATGSRLWSAQRTWAKRVLKGKSFAIIAPTGVGKTTFGILMAVYLAGIWQVRGEKPVKTYIVVPTTPLVIMAEEKAKLFAEKMREWAREKYGRDVEVRILAFHSKLRHKERRERENRLAQGDFDVLITTARFLTQRWRELVELGRRYGGFKFIFVDDVDAVLKSGKSVDAVLRVLGFTDNDVAKAQRVMKLQRSIARTINKLTVALRKSKEEANEVRRQLEKEYEELDKLLQDLEEARRKVGVLVVSSATGRPRGAKVRLFRVLLGFEAGSRSETIRNIVDSYTYPKESIEETVAAIVARLGDGGLVYVPVDLGVEYAERLAEYLNEKLAHRGLKVEAFTSKNIRALERFRSGETNILVGVAIYYGVAVRGLDLPERIRYAVFAGIPRLKFSAKFEDPHPLNILRALALLAEYAPEDVKREAEQRLARVRRELQRLSPAALQRIAQELRTDEWKSDERARFFMEQAEFIRRALSRDDVWSSLEKAPDISIRREESKAYILIPDAATYIQASGRTSRLYAGGITKGLSVVVVDDERLLNGLIKRTRWMVEAEWRRFEELDLSKLLKEIDEDRKRVREVMEGKVKEELKQELVKTALMIVESPNKARTIASFFGKPSVRVIGPLKVYEVSTGDYILLIAASGGHVYDLVKPLKPQERITSDWLLDELSGSTTLFDWATAVNSYGVLVASRGASRYLPVYAPLARCLICGHQWAPDPATYNPVKGPRKLRCPICGSPFVKSSWDIVEALRDIATEVDLVLIGTDPDTEGEKIGWDLANLITVFNTNRLRVEFHEITRKAILNAIRNPRDFDENLVKAQIVRRVEDRWIGFSLSPILWTDFWPKFCMMTLERKLEKKLKELLKSGLSREKARKVLEKLREEMIRQCSRPNYNLSAGRVQTPVLGWIVERSLHYEFEKIPFYRLRFTSAKASFEIEVKATDIDAKLKDVMSKIREAIEESVRDARMKDLIEIRRKLLDLMKEKRRIIKELSAALRRGEAKAIVEVVEEKVEELKPLPPYTTDSMLAEAAERLGMSAPEAMRIAQDLFELGLITYHRTDSIRVSDAGIAVAREYLKEVYGEDKLSEIFVPRTWGTGGAHEAIRPTRPIDAERLRRLIEEGIIQLARPLTRRHYELYNLIFRRFIASQMKPAKVRIQRARIKIMIAGRESVLEEERVVDVIDPGFLNVYELVKVMPRLEPGEYSLEKLVKVLKRSIMPPMTQAEAVKMMRSRGIGRPSTYAKIIETLLRRGYVISLKKGLLRATAKGVGVYGYLYENFKELVSEETTRSLQEAMDAIERGEQDYQEVLDRILEQLHAKLESRPEFADKAPPLPGGEG